MTKERAVVRLQATAEVCIGPFFDLDAIPLIVEEGLGLHLFATYQVWGRCTSMNYTLHATQVPAGVTLRMETRMPTRAGSASEPGRAAHEPGAPGSSAQCRLRLCTQQGLEREVHEAGAGQNFAKLLSIFLKQNLGCFRLYRH